jgi:hypothetical protein
VQAHRQDNPEVVAGGWLEVKYLYGYHLVSVVRVIDETGLAAEDVQKLVIYNQCGRGIFRLVEDGQAGPLVLCNVKLFAELSVSLVAPASACVDFVCSVVDCAAEVDTAELHWLHLSGFPIGLILGVCLVSCYLVCDLEASGTFFLTAYDVEGAVCCHDHTKLGYVQT